MARGRRTFDPSFKCELLGFIVSGRMLCCTVVGSKRLCLCCPHTEISSQHECQDVRQRLGRRTSECACCGKPGLCATYKIGFYLLQTSVSPLYSWQAGMCSRVRHMAMHAAWYTTHKCIYILVHVTNIQEMTTVICAGTCFFRLCHESTGPGKTVASGQVIARPYFSTEFQ